MSQYHRRQLIEQSFSQAEQMGEANTGKYHASISWFCLAADKLAWHVGFSDKFDFADYRGGRFPDDSREWADKHVDRLRKDPVDLMSEWIDQHPRAQAVVDNYCAKLAQEDLARFAQSQRPAGSDLASPDEVIARRNRGRML